MASSLCRFGGHLDEDWAENFEAFHWDRDRSLSLFQTAGVDYIAIGDGPGIRLDAQLNIGTCLSSSCL